MEKNLRSLMNKKYRVSLHFDPDGYWVAEHPELPGCVADGETGQEALSSLDEARELWIESRLATGLEVPEPQEEPQYSGKFVLRIAKSMHRELAREADAEGVSLNTHISNLLAGRNAATTSPSAHVQEDLQGILRNVFASEFAQQEPLAFTQPVCNVTRSILSRKLIQQGPLLSAQEDLYGKYWDELSLPNSIAPSCITSSRFKVEQEKFAPYEIKQKKKEAPYEC